VNESYSYLTLRAHRDRIGLLRSRLREEPESGLGRSGGMVVGAWLGAGSIGWPDDEGIVLLGWPDQPGDVRKLTEDLGVESWDERGLQATLRPKSLGPVRGAGVHAHRWLDVEPGFVDEAVDLSAQAWPAFEASFDTTIEGLFRTTDGSNRLLLITWYRSVAEWERSRGVPGATRAPLDEARRLFQRRRQLTTRQVVRIAPPIFPM
jgi:hypothetical protein